MQDPLNASYPVLPLRDIVVFPHMIVPLFVGREKSVRALEEVMQDDKQILLSSQIDPADDDPAEGDIYRVGVLANVLQLLKLPDGTVKVLVEGVARVRITEYLENDDFFEARAEYVSETPGDATTIEALLRSVGDEFARYAKVKKNIPDEALAAVTDSDEAAKLADLVAGHLGIEVDRKQDLLETLSVSERLEKVYGLMQGEMSVLQVEKKIKTRVKSQMERTQREYYLNEQMKAIQKELGDGEDGEGEIAELEERIANTKLSKEAKDKAEAELKKLLLLRDLDAQMARHQIRQLGGVVGLGHGGERLVGDVLLDLGITRELVGDGAQQRLDRGGVARHFLQVLGARLEKIVVFQILGDAHPRDALDQHLDGAVGQFQQLQHIGQHADAVDVALCRVVIGRVDLARQQDLLVVLHHLFQRAHRLVAPYEKRHDHMREHHDISQRQHGIGCVEWVLHARFPVLGKRTPAPASRQPRPSPFRLGLTWGRPGPVSTDVAQNARPGRAPQGLFPPHSQHFHRPKDTSCIFHSIYRSFRPVTPPRRA